MNLKTRLFGQTFNFKDVKDVLAKANEIKSGDILAGIAAEDAQERIAAKRVLSELTLEDLRRNPIIPLKENEVSRIIDADVNEPIYQTIKNWSVADSLSKSNFLRIADASIRFGYFANRESSGLETYVGTIMQKAKNVLLDFSFSMYWLRC